MYLQTHYALVIGLHRQLSAAAEPREVSLSLLASPPPRSAPRLMPASKPSSEIDELADNPALQPDFAVAPVRLAKPARQRVIEANTLAAARADSPQDSARGGRPVENTRRTEPSRQVAEAGGAAARNSLARFRYSGPTAGPHQRFDPNTLSDGMDSSDPLGTDAASAPPRKRAPHSDLSTSTPVKKRTLSASNRYHGRPDARVPDLHADKPVATGRVFVMPEFDEDGNLIEDENQGENSGSSPCRAPASALASSPATRPPSSVELPSRLAQRIYQSSPHKRTKPSSCSAPDRTKPAGLGTDLAQQNSSPAGPPGSTRRLLPNTPYRASATMASPAQRAAPRPTKPQLFAPKSLSNADLLAMEEVLADLDSRAFDDLDDLDLPYPRKESAPAAPGALRPGSKK